MVWVVANFQSHSDTRLSAEHENVYNVIEINWKIKRWMFIPKCSTLKGQKSLYLLLKACFEVQDLLAIMEPVSSHYSLLPLSKYTWPPFKTFA